MQTGSAKSYRCFVRNWYTWGDRNPTTGTRQKLCQAGRKTSPAQHCTWEEAVRICKEYNATHNPGPLSRKDEFEEE